MPDRYAQAVALNARYRFLEDPDASISCDRAAPVPEGSLADLLVGVKSNVAVRGQAQTAGLRSRAGTIADTDAPVVAALRECGARFLSRTTMDAAALGAATEAHGWQATDNPRVPGYSVGGSSGGSAAAVACGAVDAALATDTLGSVRIPAAYCGVLGLKPGQGLLPLDGVFPLAPKLDAVGFLARETDVLRRLLAVFEAAPIRQSLTVQRLATPDGLQADIKGLSPYHIGAVAGWDVPTLRKAAFVCMLQEARSTLQECADLPASVTKALSYAARLSDADIADAKQVCATAVAGVTEVLETGTVLLTPTTPQPAFQRGQRPPTSQADYTAVANLAGVPALAVPAGQDAQGRPLSVQLIGPMGSELALLDLADELALA